MFITDRLSHPDKEAGAWPTFFTLDSKKTVLSTKRICKKPSGSGYRNYWLSVVPGIVQNMTKPIKKGDF